MLDITPDAGTVKTGEARVVPLHEHLVELGFLDFVKARAKGPLFYDPTRRRNNFAKTSQAESRGGDISQWVRKATGLDPRIAPNHTWRKMFKSIAVEAGIDARLSDWLTGHAGQKRKRGAAAGYEFRP